MNTALLMKIAKWFPYVFTVAVIVGGYWYIKDTIHSQNEQITALKKELVILTGENTSIKEANKNLENSIKTIKTETELMNQRIVDAEVRAKTLEQKFKNPKFTTLTLSNLPLAEQQFNLMFNDYLHQIGAQK